MGENGNSSPFVASVQSVQGVLERVSAPVAFPWRQLVLSAALTPVTWPVTAQRVCSHAGVAGPVQRSWRSVAVFLGSQTGLVLLDYTLRLALSRALSAVQAIVADEEGGEKRQAGERAGHAARWTGALVAAMAVNWVGRLWLRGQVRREALGEEAAARVVVSPSLWEAVVGAFLSVFPFGRMEVLRVPVQVAVGNVLAQSEVRMARNAEVGVLSSVERAIDDDSRGWGVLVAGLPHGEHTLRGEYY